MQGNVSHVLGYLNISVRANYVDLVLTVSSCALLFFTLFVGIAANLFVAWAVHNQKSLQTANNALLVNLAVIDFLRCVIDCPLILAIFLNGERIDKIGFSLCNAQFASFAITCCVQLLTLASISAERYQAIAHPFKTTERRKRVRVWIPSTWIVAIIVSIICSIFVRDSPVYVRCKGLDVKELPSYETFGMYILIPLWAACLVVITGFYSRIFILVKAHSRKIFDKGTTLDDINSKAKSTDATKVDDSTIKDIVKMVPDVTVKTDVSRAQEKRAFTANILASGGHTVSAPLQAADQNLTLDKHLPETNNTTRVLADTNNSTQHASPSQSRTLVLIDIEKREVDSTPHPQPLTAPGTATLESAEEKQPGTQTAPVPPEPEEDIAGAVCMMPLRFNADRAKTNKENKLAKRSGYIILTFIILWTPFISTVLGNYVIGWSSSTRMEIALELKIFTISLVCMTSVTNPITYAVVNPQFRTEFYSLRSKFKSMCSTK
ncbi:uncharacterized protein LOC121724180 [Alosa sapidissima]|uniref:uncharacterized protein LOC121724180 n=1 Tax=Alosa sapidissima TaxID=34773 RepID=UPI001C0A4920|nr:uncharacterized protein LOC121724180 [Alosa sapidissima]